MLLYSLCMVVFGDISRGPYLVNKRESSPTKRPASNCKCVVCDS
jgi:hypothetical protein